MKTLIVALLCVFFLEACAVSHVSTYKPKRRAYDLTFETNPAVDTGTAGSLYRPGQNSARLFTDARALRENDLVVVKVEEVADARRSTDTQLTHDSKMSADVNAFLQLAGTRDASGKAGGGLQTQFEGMGSTKRSEHLVATVPALVRKVMANGLLFVEGHRVVLINSEEHHFYISGVVRPIDIDEQNSVKSSMLADAEVEFTGKGILTETERQGWLSRFLKWIWPF